MICSVVAQYSRQSTVAFSWEEVSQEKNPVWLVMEGSRIVFQKKKEREREQDFVTLFTCHHSPVSACPEGNNILAVLLGGLGTQTQTRRLFGWSNLGLSRLIFSHIILFILLAEDYSFSQPNSLKGNTWPMHIQACSVWPILTYWERNKTLLLCKRQVRGSMLEMTVSNLPCPQYAQQLSTYGWQSSNQTGIVSAA